LVPHFSGRFLLTASLRRRRISVFISLFTVTVPVNYAIECEPGSVVGIATAYVLDGSGSNPGVARFSAPVQTGPGAHPAPCTMGAGSLPGVKSGRGVTLTPHPLQMPWS
jgi:hypothetical protein